MSCQSVASMLKICVVRGSAIPFPLHSTSPCPGDLVDEVRFAHAAVKPDERKRTRADFKHKPQVDPFAALRRDRSARQLGRDHQARQIGVVLLPRLPPSTTARKSSGPQTHPHDGVGANQIAHERRFGTLTKPAARGARILIHTDLARLR